MSGEPTPGTVNPDDAIFYLGCLAKRTQVQYQLGDEWVDATDQQVALMVSRGEARHLRVKPKDVAKEWRTLALMRDHQRMQALGHLRLLLDDHLHYEEATRFLAAAPVPGTELLDKVREELRAEQDGASLTVAIDQVMKDHFRTDSDTGSQPNAMLVMNAFRGIAGMSRIQIEDLNTWCSECKKYHARPVHAALQPFKKGDRVRRKVLWPTFAVEATVTYAHANGALDVAADDGAVGGWSAQFCELVSRPNPEEPTQ